MPRQRKRKGPDLRATRRYLQILCWGYKDFEEGSPGKRQPAGDPLCDDVVNYWEGWNAGVQDATSKFFRERRERQSKRIAA
jgi:hypothetical protein